MVRTPSNDLERNLKDLEYRKLYGASDSKAEIAIALSQARQMSKKTQKELANTIGLSQPYIAKLEGGEANPSIATVGSILAVLGYCLVADIKPLLSHAIPQVNVAPSTTGGEWFENTAVAVGSVNTPPIYRAELQKVGAASGGEA